MEFNEQVNHTLDMVLHGGGFKKIIKDCYEPIRTEYELKQVDLEVLVALNIGQNVRMDTPTDIYNHLHISKGHVSLAIDHLLKERYIEAFVDDKDRRVVHYRITETGANLVRKMDEKREQLRDKLLQGLSDEEKNVFYKCLANIMENMNKLFE